MKKRSSAKRAPQTTSTTRWRTYLLMLACALLLVAGFFFAARQHFSSMDTGMKNSRLRKQIDDLEAEKRRLVLAREVSLSPAEIKKAAKRSGLTLPEVAVSGEVAQVSSTTKDKAIPPAAVATAAKKPLIEKTAAVSPAPRTVAASYSKPERSVKQDRKGPIAE